MNADKEGVQVQDLHGNLPLEQVSMEVLDLDPSLSAFSKWGPGGGPGPPGLHFVEDRPGGPGPPLGPPF